MSLPRWIALFVVLVVAGRSLGRAGDTSLVSVSTGGAQGNGASDAPAVSSDGNVVVFLSSATDLVAGGSNGHRHTYVRFRSQGVTMMVSAASSGAEANDDSFNPAISADGRFAAFANRASNLVANDTNDTWDIFVVDLHANTIERASVGSNGEEANAFSFDPTLSADGRYVCFVSLASNLVSGDSSGLKDIFVRDRLLGITERESVSSDGIEANAQTTVGRISTDGRYVAMVTYASNLAPNHAIGMTDVLVRDRVAGTTSLVSCSYQGGPADGASQSPAIGSGRFIAFASDATNIVPGDNNGATDIFVRDMLVGTTERASVGDGGTELDGPSRSPTMTCDGRFVGFASDATNAVPGDLNGVTDAFVRDRLAGTTLRVSVSSSGQQGDAPSGAPVLSADGSVAVFQSDSSILVTGDSNGVTDVFAHQLADRVPVSGHILFGSHGVPPTPVALRLQWTGWDVPFAELPASVDSGGGYALQIPPGEVELSIKPSHWLRRTVDASVGTEGLAGMDLDLVNGDAFGDNRVDLLDLSVVLAEFGRAGPDGDMDDSGSVDLLDLSIVLSNFGAVGDQ